MISTRLLARLVDVMRRCDADRLLAGESSTTDAEWDDALACAQAQLKDQAQSLGAQRDHADPCATHQGCVLRIDRSGHPGVECWNWAVALPNGRFFDAGGASPSIAAALSSAATDGMHALEEADRCWVALDGAPITPAPTSLAGEDALLLAVAVEGLRQIASTPRNRGARERARAALRFIETRRAEWQLRTLGAAANAGDDAAEPGQVDP